jgi:hypothetical protein
MASSSSTSAVPASLSIPIFEKLTQDSFRLWHAQVLPALRVAQREGFIEGSDKAPTKTMEVERDSKTLVVPNPGYVIWCVRDQHVLTYLVTSLSREVLAGVARNTTAAAMWAAITKMFASQSRSRILHLRNQLVATKKGEVSITTYFSTMSGYANEMAAARKPLDDDDTVSYILNGLEADYNSLIEQVNGMTEPISPETLYSRLLDTEAHLASQKVQRDQKEQYQLMANSATRGNNGGSKQYTRGGHQGHHGGDSHPNGTGSSPGNPNNPYKNHQCDIC